MAVHPSLALLPLLVATACRPAAPLETAPAEGWIPLFNGEDLTGWTPKFVGHEPGVNHKDTFRVRDGVLRVAYERYDEFGDAFGHLFYATEYGHYRLRLEYRFIGEQSRGAPGWALRNNGVMIHAQPPQTMRRMQAFPVAIEVQLLGGDGSAERPTGNLCTPGTHVEMDDELVTQHCVNSSSPTYSGDGWVRLEIEVRGGDVIRHVINDATVLEYRRPQLDPADADAQAWIARRGGRILLDRGAIALQAESHPTEFRSIELLPLPESAAP